METRGKPELKRLNEGRGVSMGFRLYLWGFRPGLCSTVASVHADRGPLRATKSNVQGELPGYVHESPRYTHPGNVWRQLAG